MRGLITDITDVGILKLFLLNFIVKSMRAVTGGRNVIVKGQA